MRDELCQAISCPRYITWVVPPQSNQVMGPVREDFFVVILSLLCTHIKTPSNANNSELSCLGIRRHTLIVACWVVNLLFFFFFFFFCHHNKVAIFLTSCGVRYSGLCFLFMMFGIISDFHVVLWWWWSKSFLSLMVAYCFIVGNMHFLLRRINNQPIPCALLFYSFHLDYWLGKE